MQSPAAIQGAREKLSERGIDSLSDAELIALLLGTGTSDAPVSVLAERLLCELGGLHSLGRASLGQLAAIKGVGTGKSARIVAGLELGRRVSARPLERGSRIASSEDVYRAFGPLLAQQQHEELWAIALDARQRILTRIQLARGGLSTCPVSIADVFRPLIREGAAAMIVIHNHPSGAPDPSPEDLAFTERVAQAGELLGIFLLDHVIVAADGYYSCLDAGLYSGGGRARQASSGPRSSSLAAGTTVRGFTVPGPALHSRAQGRASTSQMHGAAQLDDEPELLDSLEVPCKVPAPNESPRAFVGET